MGIDVSICVSSPLVYSYLIYSLSPLIFFASLPPSLLNIKSVLMPLSSFLIASSPLAPCLSSPCFYPPFCPLPYLLSFPLPIPQLSSALMFDAVHVVVGAVRELNRSQEIGVKPLSCTSPQIWQHGTSLMNYLRMVNACQCAVCTVKPTGCSS